MGTVLGTARTLEASLGCTGVGCWAVGSRHCLHLWQLLNVQGVSEALAGDGRSLLTMSPSAPLLPFAIKH